MHVPLQTTTTPPVTVITPNLVRRKTETFCGS